MKKASALIVILFAWTLMSCSTQQTKKEDHSGLFIANDRNGWGFINRDGRRAAKFIWAGAQNFSEGLAPVQDVGATQGATRIQGRWGYIDTQDKIVINPKFYIAGRFHDGFALVTPDPESKQVFIDRTGKVAPFQFDAAREFSEGLACVRSGGKFGYIDTTGKLVISPRFENCYDFSEGLAPVELEGKWGYIDRTGTVTIDPQFPTADEFSEGLAVVEKAPFDPNRKYGYLDKTGRMVISPEFDVARKFSEGVAFFKAKDLWGCIDASGRVLISAQFQRVEDFSDGLAKVSWDGKKWGYVDHSGNVVINPQFDSAGSFFDGLAWVGIGEKYGYIDKSGKYVWQSN